MTDRLRSLASRRYFEFGILGLLVLSSLVLQRVLTSGCCEGPDLVAYFEIAQLQATQPEFWSDPEAFNGNFWAMAYPTFLYLVLGVGGGSLEVVQWIQMVLAAGLSVGAWLLAFPLGRGLRLAAATVVAWSPTTLWIGASLGYEVLLATLLLTSLVFALSPLVRGKGGGVWARLLVPGIAGLALGLALLTQSKTLVLVPLIAYLLWRQGRRELTWGGVGFLIPVGAWMVRNLAVLGNPSPLTRNGGYNLWAGNNPEVTNGGSMFVPDIPASAGSEFSAGLNFIISQPEVAIGFVFRKAMRMWEPLFIYPDLFSPGPVRTLLHLGAALLGGVLLVGFVLYLGGRVFSRPPQVPTVGPIAVFVLLFYAVHLPFIAEPRFMSAVHPMIVTVALPTLVYAWTRQREILRTRLGSASDR